MTRAIEIVGRGGWSGEPADCVVLGFEDRRRRHGAVVGVRGLAIELALRDALTLRTGDALRLEDGRFVEVVAAPEPLVEVRCADAQELARVAWHFGNRHVPLQIVGQKLRLRDDADLAPVIAHLGLKATPIEAPFDPEGGAYAPETIVERSGHACGCGHHHHDHDGRGHAHDHAHGAHAHGAHAHGAHAHGDHVHGDHVHSGGCCGGHGHEHRHARDHGDESVRAHERDEGRCGGHLSDHGHDHGHGGCGCAGKS